MSRQDFFSEYLNSLPPDDRQLQSRSFEQPDAPSPNGSSRPRGRMPTLRYKPSRRDQP